MGRGKQVAYSVTVWNGIDRYGSTLPDVYKTIESAELAAKKMLAILGETAHIMIRRDIEYYDTGVSVSEPQKLLANSGYVPPDI